MRFGRGAALLAAAMMAGGLAGCGGGDEPTEPSTTVSPRTPVGQGKTNEASQGKTSDASGSESSSESTGKSSSSTSGEGGNSSVELPEGIPTVAKKRTKEGAAAFGKYYYDQLGEAARTGDESELALLGLNSCPPCSEATKSVRKDFDKGRVRSINPYSFSRVQSTKRPDEGYKVTMEVAVEKHKALDDGEVYGNIRATEYRLTEHVVWRDGKWQVADWVIS